MHQFCRRLAGLCSLLHKAAVSTLTAASPEIVVLDGYTLNPGDLSWRELEALGHCIIHDRTPAAHVVERAQHAELVLTNKTVLTRDQIGACPKLRYIGVLATGYKGPDHLVGTLFGPEVAQRVGRVWGFDEEAQELRNMWMRTPQPGLWFTGGSFSQCRMYSKYLAMQIKAAELGLV